MQVYRVKKNKYGYSHSKYLELFGENVEVSILKGSGLEPINGYDKKKQQRTDEIVGQRLEVYIHDVGAQNVKLPKDFNVDGINDLSQIELVEPEACVVKGQIYVQAKGVKVVK